MEKKSYLAKYHFFFESVEERLNIFYLEKNEQKLQLIELLLLIGTLYSAFNLEKGWIWLYVLFTLVSVLYFITIQKTYHSKTQLKYISLISFLVAILFSALLSGNLFICLPRAELSPSLSLVYAIIILILFIIYYICISMILWIALKKKDILD